MALSFRETEEIVRKALPKPIDGYVWIDGIFPDKVVYAVENKIGPVKRFEAPYLIDGNVAKLGTSVEVVRKTVYEVVKASFTASVAQAGQVYAYEGKIWEAAQFTDKDYSEEDAKADLPLLVDGFTEQDINLSHVNTVLSGKLGKMTKVWANGLDLYGRVEFPKPVVDLLGKEPIKCSIEIDRQAKKIVGLALCDNPRVSDAQLIAAFSASEEAPKPMNDTLTKDDVGFIQKLKALFSVGGGAADNPTATENTQLRAELDQVKAELAKFSTEQGSKTEAERIRANAVAFADGLISTNKALPAERDFIVSQFEAAARNQVVVFSDTGALNESPALKELKGFFEGRTPHFFTQAVIPNSGSDGGEKIDANAIYGRMNGQGGK